MVAVGWPGVIVAVQNTGDAGITPAAGIQSLGRRKFQTLPF
jgi:hypothetical protein